MPDCFSGSSIKFQGHTGWKIDDLNPIWVGLLGRSQLSNPSDLPCCKTYNKYTWMCKYYHAYLQGYEIFVTYLVKCSVLEKILHIMIRLWAHHFGVFYTADVLVDNIITYSCAQWINSSWPIDVIWWHRSGSTLVQVMACCLTAPSIYTNLPSELWINLFTGATRNRYQLWAIM